MDCGEYLMESPSGATYLQSSFCSLIQHNINVVLFMLQFSDVICDLTLSHSQVEVKYRNSKNSTTTLMFWFYIPSPSSYCDFGCMLCYNCDLLMLSYCMLALLMLIKGTVHPKIKHIFSLLPVVLFINLVLL